MWASTVAQCRTMSSADNRPAGLGVDLVRARAAGRDAVVAGVAKRLQVVEVQRRAAVADRPYMVHVHAHPASTSPASLTLRDLAQLDQAD